MLNMPPFIRCLFNIFLFECMIKGFLDQSYLLSLFLPLLLLSTFMVFENDNGIIEDTESHFCLYSYPFYYAQ